MYRNATLAVLTLTPFISQVTYGQSTFEAAQSRYDDVATDDFEMYLRRRKHAATKLYEAYKRKRDAAAKAVDLEKASQIDAEMKAFLARERTILEALSQAAHAEPDRDAAEGADAVRKRKPTIEGKVVTLPHLNC